MRPASLRGTRERVRCHRCGAEAPAAPVAVRAVCPCGARLHACLNCDFYAPGLANDCREPRAERVVDKAAGNFCDWFRPGTRGATSREGSGTDAARAALDALFRKRGPGG